MNVSSARELLDLTSLRDIQFYEVHARLDAGFSDSDTQEDERDESKSQHWDLQLQLKPQSLGVRCRLAVRAPDACYTVDAAVFYDFAESVEIEREALNEFVNRAAFIALYPYLRESLHDAARRISAQLPVLGMWDPMSNRIEFEVATV